MMEFTTTTSLEARLKECKTIRECFTIQNSLGDKLSHEEELKLRAKYAGLTLEEAARYEDSLNYVLAIEARPAVTRQLESLSRAVCNMIAG